MVLVDTNVLIDVALDDPRWGEWSADHLERARETQALARAFRAIRREW